MLVMRICRICLSIIVFCVLVCGCSKEKSDSKDDLQLSDPAVAEETVCLSESANCFDNAVSVIIYDIDPHDYQKNRQKSDILENITRAEFDIDTFKTLARFMKRKKGHVIWKGGSTAIVRFADNTEMVLGVSYYGSFFRITGTSDYFVFGNNKAAADKWRKEYKKKIFDVFLKARELKAEQIDDSELLPGMIFKKSKFDRKE